MCRRRRPCDGPRELWEVGLEVAIQLFGGFIAGPVKANGVSNRARSRRSLLRLAAALRQLGDARPTHRRLNIAADPFAARREYPDAAEKEAEVVTKNENVGNGGW